MTLSLPIPGKKEKFSFFYIPYFIGRDYSNFKGEVSMKESDSIRDFREAIVRKYPMIKNSGGFIITTV